MGSSLASICNIIDSFFLFFFAFISIVAPLMDAQTCLPSRFFPSFLVTLKSSYAYQYGDFLITERPHFFVGVVWLELLLQWPLAVANVYGIIRRRRWFQITCLIYGVSTFSGMAAIVGELIGSGKASKKLLAMYLPFMGIPIIAVLRGLTPSSSSSAHIKAA